MTKKQSQQIQQAFEAYYIAHEKLNTLWQEADHTGELFVPAYPFDKCFFDLQMEVKNWVDTSIKSLNIPQELPTIEGFKTIDPKTVKEDDSTFWLYDNPDEVQFYLLSEKNNLCIAFLYNGMYYTEAMQESQMGSLKDCIKFLENELGEPVI